MNDLCAAIGQAYGNYYKQLPRIRVKGRHIDLISEHYAIEIIHLLKNTSTVIVDALTAITTKTVFLSNR